MLAHGIILALSLMGIANAGNTTCLNNSMDWFTQSVGESPCQVYERLRGTCSPGFQVGNMPNTAPGDTCGDQVSACCCNTVAFALSMLCMSCQWGIGSGVNQDFGFDAPVGTYGKYLSNCGRPSNRTLPDTVQMATCKQNIKIPSYVYNPSWETTGEWYFYYTRQTAELQIKSGENETSICADMLLKAAASSNSVASATQSLAFPTSTTGNDLAANRDSPPPVGAIVGGVFGGLALLAGGAVVGYFFSRRRTNRGVVDLMEESDKPGMVYEPYPLNHLSPARAQLPGSTTHGANSLGWTYVSGSSSSAGHGSSIAPAPAPIVAPVTVPGRQKGGVVDSISSGPGGDAGPSRSLLHHRNSSEENQANTRVSIGTELPPSYEPRR